LCLVHSVRRPPRRATKQRLRVGAAGFISQKAIELRIQQRLSLRIAHSCLHPPLWWRQAAPPFRESRQAWYQNAAGPHSVRSRRCLSFLELAPPIALAAVLLRYQHSFTQQTPSSDHSHRVGQAWIRLCAGLMFALVGLRVWPQALGVSVDAINTPCVSAGHSALFHVVSRLQNWRFRSSEPFLGRVRFPAAPPRK
jgi:hypothetical protein